MANVIMTSTSTWLMDKKKEKEKKNNLVNELWGRRWASRSVGLTVVPRIVSIHSSNAGFHTDRWRRPCDQSSIVYHWPFARPAATTSHRA
jgi:hypothetical protein